MTAITKPGIFDGLPAEVYHGNCTPEPALSAGFAIKMQTHSPAKAWVESSLNPNYKPENKRAFDIGTALHLAVLEPDEMERRVHLIRLPHKDGGLCDNYNTKAAQDARDAAYAAGLTPLLPTQAETVQNMRLALRNELPGLPFNTAPAFAGSGFEGGLAEASMFWQHPRVGVWCRARADYLRDPLLNRPGLILDLKTTGTVSTDADEAERHAYKMRWYMRAAHYIDGYKALTGHTLPYWFVSVETEFPHFVTVSQLDEDQIQEGRHEMEKAALTFNLCVQSGRWPEPVSCRQARILRAPDWAAKQQERRRADALKPTVDELKAMSRMTIDMQAPISKGAA